jgi:molybdopterin synthase sulfur carrier subunit
VIVMPVTLLIPTTLRAEAADRRSLTMAATGTLGAVLDELAGAWPRLERRVRDESGALRRYVNIYIDGVDCRELGGVTAPVQDGAELQIIPSVAGG